MKVIKSMCLTAIRLTQEDGQYSVQVSVAGGDTLSWSFDQEEDANSAYETLGNTYLEASTKLSRRIISIHEEDDTTALSPE